MEHYEITIPNERYDELVQLEGRIKYLVRELADDRKALEKADILSIIGTADAIMYARHFKASKKFESDFGDLSDED